MESEPTPEGGLSTTGAPELKMENDNRLKMEKMAINDNESKQEKMDLDEENQSKNFWIEQILEPLLIHIYQRGLMENNKENMELIIKVKFILFELFKS